MLMALFSLQVLLATKLELAAPNLDPLMKRLGSSTTKVSDP